MSSGTDNISAKMMNICSNTFSENPTKIVNRTIGKLEYPVQMKMAKFIAFYKKDNDMKLITIV